MTLRLGRPIRERVRAALAAGPLTFEALAVAVFPPRTYQAAWRCAAQGGPPGCFMALSRTVRQLHCVQWSDGPGSGHRYVAWPE